MVGDTQSKSYLLTSFGLALLSEEPNVPIDVLSLLTNEPDVTVDVLAFLFTGQCKKPYHSDVEPPGPPISESRFSRMNHTSPSMFSRLSFRLVRVKK